MTVRIYKSTDASAPVLSGQAGALIALLDAVLINGYGSATPAGWAKAFSGTNLAAYRPPVGGNRFYLRIDDTGTTNGRAVGYESMSDVNTGVAGFPTETQFAGGMYWPKSNTADATARPWIIAATDRMLIMHVSSSTIANATNASICIFGDIKSYKAGDIYGTIHVGAATSAPTTSNRFEQVTVSVTGAAAPAHYITRSYAQTGGSLAVGKHTDAAKASGSIVMGGASSVLVYPNGPDGGLYMAPLWIHEIAGHVRGTIPGLWCPLHNKPIEHLDTFSGAGVLGGKTFLALKIYSAGECFLETSDTWDI